MLGLGCIQVAQTDVQFAQLLLVHWAWCLGEQTLSTLGLGEGNGPARLLAVQHGLESVDGLPEWQAHRKRHGWDVDDIEALRDLIGDIEYQALGYAVLFASRPLDPREKKL